MKTTLKLLLLVLCAFQITEISAVQIAVTQTSSIAITDAKPPVHNVAVIKALKEAHAQLNLTDSEPKEVNAVLQMLKDNKERAALELPRGSKAWCPSLKVGLKLNMHKIIPVDTSRSQIEYEQNHTSADTNFVASIQNFISWDENISAAGCWTHH